MNQEKHWTATLGLLFGSAVALAITGCATYDDGPHGSGASYESPQPGDSAYVEIRAEGDFEEPLSPYGRWEIVGSYGRCWIPERVEADWSPYADGYWRSTEGGWYWESEEPWGWATYHYGRWDSDPQFGWYWVPQTHWAPAWVSWRHGDGYTGWAPLGPSGRAGGERDRRRAASGGYVFVEDHQFLEPVRHQTVVVNATIINRTVINEVPSTVVIEKASGRKVQATPVRELRRKDEAAAVTKHPALAAQGVKRGAPPARPQAERGTSRNEPRPAAKVPPESTESRRTVTRAEDARAQAPNHLAKTAEAKPAPKTDSRQVRKVTAPKAEHQPAVTTKPAVRTDEPRRTSKPVVEKPAQPDELRVPEQKRSQPAPAPLPTKAKIKRAPQPKEKPEVKVQPDATVVAPAPQKAPPEKKKPGTDGEEDDAPGRSGPGRREQ